MCHLAFFFFFKVLQSVVTGPSWTIQKIIYVFGGAEQSLRFILQLNIKFILQIELRFYLA